jgi:uncharacterized protein YndB with AHSA1/START domain
MSVNEIWVDAPPEVVFDVLEDPYVYGHWVPGATRTRRADDNWPEPGSVFHHSQGVFGLGWPDNTEVVSATRPRTLVLEARIRPFAVNKVELRLAPSGGGTKVVMVEYPTGGLARFVPRLVTDIGLWLRNVEALRRLRNLAEERAAA